MFLFIQNQAHLSVEGGHFHLLQHATSCLCYMRKCKVLNTAVRLGCLFSLIFYFVVRWIVNNLNLVACAFFLDRINVTTMKLFTEWCAFKLFFLMNWTLYSIWAEKFFVLHHNTTNVEYIFWHVFIYQLIVRQVLYQQCCICRAAHLASMLFHFLSARIKFPCISISLPPK